jgi:hypothetical protein
MNQLERYLTLILFLLSVAIAAAQNFAGGFAFSLPARDSTRSPFLPWYPAQTIGTTDLVGIDGSGHFAVQGQRIRFWGTNCGADAAFPALDKAPFLAARLRKMGFNLVRMHHLDNPWSSYSLFDRDSDTRHLNTAMLRRLEKYIYELKRNGIHVNINLHVSRTFDSRDGVADADSILDYGKGVSFIDRDLWPLYKEYASQLLTHRNPYTNVRLVDDPVMAMVEITNENSLYRWWRDGLLKPFKEGGRLTLRYCRMLDDQWLAFLRQKYGSTAQLASAWQSGARDGSQRELIVDGGFEKGQISRWQMEQHETARATMALTTQQPYAGSLAAKVTVTAVTGTSWHIQWKQTGFSLEKDSLYTVRFAGRSDASRPMSLAVMRDTSPWTGYGSANFQLTAAWQRFSFTFKAPENCIRESRLSFHLGGQTGSCWFDEISIQPASVSGLLAEESLEAGTVRRIDYSQSVMYTDARVADMSAFYLKLQDDFYAEMSRYLKQDLGVRVPVVGTNWNVGAADIAVQAKLDYIDNHAYWDHPDFPNEPWSSTDWTIANTPMVLAEDGGSISRVINATPVAGMPFTISEYNHCFPNRYQSEGPLFLCSYAALADADAVMLFDNGGSNDNFESDFIDSYFGIHRNTAMMALMPACAAAFRAGLIAPAQQTIGLALSETDLLTLPKEDSGDWRGPTLIDPVLALIHKVRYTTFSAASDFNPAILPAMPAPPYISDTGELVWDPAGLFQTVTPAYVAFTGLLDRIGSRAMGPLTLNSASGFASGSWLALDGESLPASRFSLLTLSTTVQNTGMVWDGTSTLHANWGRTPTQMQPVRLSLSLDIRADSIRIWPLDVAGAKKGAGRKIVIGSGSRFNLILDQSQDLTVWYGIERLGALTALQDRVDAILPARISLSQNVPNPFQPSAQGGTEIAFRLPGSGEFNLTLYDLLGRRVRQLAAGSRPAGEHRIRWDGRDGQLRMTAEGLYFYVLEYHDGGRRERVVGKLMLLN